MRIGVCGGTFDPFHRGHLEPLLSIRDAMQWDRVLYVPAAVQPFKKDRQAVSGYHRHAMAVLATESREGIDVSLIELERAGVSYTVDTLRELRTLHPEASFDWVIGEDNVAELDRWKSIEGILEMANFVVLTRPEGEAKDEGAEVPDALEGLVCDGGERPAHGAIVYVSNEAVSVSSTDIRRRIGAGEAIDDLVDPRVARYIQHYGLYRKGQS